MENQYRVLRVLRGLGRMKFDKGKNGDVKKICIRKIINKNKPQHIAMHSTVFFKKHTLTHIYTPLQVDICLIWL